MAEKNEQTEHTEQTEKQTEHQSASASEKQTEQRSSIGEPPVDERGLLFGKYKSFDEVDKALRENGRMAHELSQYKNQSQQTEGSQKSQQPSIDPDELTNQIMDKLGLDSQSLQSIKQQTESHKRQQQRQEINKNLNLNWDDTMFDRFSKYVQSNYNEAQQKVINDAIENGMYSVLTPFKDEFENSTPESSKDPGSGNTSGSEQSFGSLERGTGFTSIDEYRKFKSEYDPTRSFEHAKLYQKKLDNTPTSIKEMIMSGKGTQ